MIKNILLTCFYGIIVILSLILIYVQRKIKRLRHNPGQIIFAILVSQCIMSLFIVFSQFYNVEDSQDQQEYMLSINESICKLIAAPSLMVSLIYNLLNILLIVNLYCQIYAKNYDEINIQKEIKIGILVVTFTSLLLVLVFDELGFRRLQLRITQCFCNIFGLSKERSYYNFIYNYPPEILQTEIYKTVIDKFIKKYLQTYIKVNVAYGLLYVFARLLIPVVINYFESDQKFTSVCQFIQVIATLIMTIIRLHEPIIHRHFRHLFLPKKLVLHQRLLEKNFDEKEDTLQRSYDNIKIETIGQDINSIGIKLYRQKKSNSILLSLEQFQPLQLLPQESTYEDPQQYLVSIQHQGHNQLSLFLQASYEMFEEYQYCQNDEMTSFSFNKMQQKSIQINHHDLLITTYGQDILSYKLREYFGITLKQIKKSLDKEQNIECLKQEEVNYVGTLFLTHDNLISMEFITNEQKRQLTKGGGMQQLWSRYEQEFICELGIFLPVIIGLHSYYLDDNYYTLVFKLNRFKLKYPLIEEQWSQQFVLNRLISQNIIGWITIDNGIYNKRFLAREVSDENYKILLKRSDYLIDENDKYSLIDMIKRDYVTLQQMKCSMTIHFIFTKHTSSRLKTLVRKEKLIDQDQSIETQPKRQSNSYIGQMASFELKTKLGYVEVFWDDCWKYCDSNIDKVLEIINNKF
ncbi:unnamed protein product (macronuclear) [Paramecium tetraurelia]|uniref:Uncharacterized protein n=1 Tax=Paramecium tetraurelia TaxID=5888 RepID=A0EGW3_PARTE|nr:uncharacterized protein GSPATT00026878001 [Paramecium tetraurelia]CAK94554.1 unnamed protein product [Paramecium tetraurelia]|eukprot:XP_001461927.1 hypothetical protein (macronuclear) [Paramecium tetraurelia strain d4-2]